MIARIWHGMVPISKAGEYLKLMQTIALREYRATRGKSRRVVSAPTRRKRNAFRDAHVLGRRRRHQAFRWRRLWQGQVLRFRFRLSHRNGASCTTLRSAVGNPDRSITSCAMERMKRITVRPTSANRCFRALSAGLSRKILFKGCLYFIATSQAL
jgi:hypothetical protein